MADAQKTIGVLTSGGDSPGMNAAIRAVVRSGIAADMRVVGIKRGYHGLINGDVTEMNLRSVSDIIHQGGTILYTAPSPEFQTEAGMQKAIRVCEEYHISGLAVIGGDGSFRGASALSAHGVPCVGIPGTIDNDIAASEYTIGFDTAVNTAMDMVDRLRDTMESHDRCSVVEVMGRKAGWIALETAIAVGATAVLVPEIPCDLEKELIPRILRIQKTGKRHYIIVVAEGAGNTTEIANLIADKTSIETRATVLGHVQRGGSPTVRDRMIASEMGYHAVELLAAGQGDRVVAMKDNRVVDYDIYKALEMTKPFDKKMYQISNTINI